MGRQTGADEGPIFAPWNERGHAIADAAFIIELNQHPNSLVVNELLALHPKLRGDYPRKQEIKTQQFRFHPDAAGRPIQSFAPVVLDGFRFDSLWPDGSVARAIRLEDKMLIIGRPDYERWEKTWPEVRKVFGVMMPIIMKTCVVVNLQIQIVNRFKIFAPRGAFKPDAILRRDSDLIAAHAFKVHDLWHSFHGFFEESADPAIHRRLTVVNVQLLSGADDLSLLLDIHITQRCDLSESISDAAVLLGHDGDGGLLEAYMSSMHDSAKDVLERVLNDEACGAIRLRGSHADVNAG